MPWWVVLPTVLAGRCCIIRTNTSLGSPVRGENCLHGGTEGFDRKEWHIVSQQADKVVLSLHSPDGDKAFLVSLTPRWHTHLQGSDLVIEIEATVSKPCPVNMTCHGYFNLDGKRSDVRDHALMVNADTIANRWHKFLYLPTTGGSSTDLRHQHCLREQWLSHPQLMSAKGFDHCYVLAKAMAQNKSLPFGFRR